MNHPYRGLPSTNFWSSAVQQSSPGGLDPVIGFKVKISPNDKVATM